MPELAPGPRTSGAAQKVAAPQHCWWVYLLTFLDYLLTFGECGSLHWKVGMFFLTCLSLPPCSFVGVEFLLNHSLLKAAMKPGGEETLFKLFEISKQIFFFSELYYLKKVSIHNTNFSHFWPLRLQKPTFPWLQPKHKLSGKEFRISLSCAALVAMYLHLKKISTPETEQCC